MPKTMLRLLDRTRSISVLRAGLAVAVLAATMLAGADAARAGACQLDPDSGLAGAILQRTNALRASHGLPALRPDPKLAAAARTQACWMAARAAFTHVGQGGADIRQRTRQVGYRGCVMAENIAWGYKTADTAMAGWQQSPHHLAILLNRNVRDFGLALAWHGNKPYWSMVVGQTC